MKVSRGMKVRMKVSRGMKVRMKVMERREENR